MNIYAAVPLLGLFAYAFLIILSLRHPRRAERHAFSLYLASAGIWSLVSFFLHLDYPIVHEYILPGSKVLILAIVWMMVAYYHFLRVFVQRPAWPGVCAGVAFVLGVSFAAGKPGLQLPNKYAWPHDVLLYKVGWFFMVLGMSYVGLIILLRGGPAVLTLSYRVFRDNVLSFPLFLQGVQMSAYGCFLAVCGAGGRRWKTPVVTWIIFGGSLAVVGNRSLLAVPLLGLLVMLTTRGVRFRKIVIGGGVAALMMIMSAIGVIRVVGFSQRGTVNWTSVTPLDTLAEIGGTLRAAYAPISWIQEGDDYLYGGSYWAPIDRHFLRFVLFRRRVSLEDDPMAVASLTYHREGSVGTSAVGEAYYNFGILGPIIYFGILGRLFGWADRRAPDSPYRLAILCVLMTQFYWNIRGSFLSIPLQTTVGLLIIGLCSLFRPHHPESTYDTAQN